VRLSNDPCVILSFSSQNKDLRGLFLCKSRIVVSKAKATPLQVCTGPEGSKTVRLAEIIDNRQMKLARLSALRIGRLYPPRKYSWYSFLVRGWVDPRAIVRPEGLSQWKILMAPFEIEPATFRFVAQCLNQLRHSVPPYIKVFGKEYKIMKLFTLQFLTVSVTSSRLLHDIKHLNGKIYIKMSIVIPVT
jgi:hypothetical protein